MSNTTEPTDTTHFGYEEVPTAEKEQRVGEVFRSVAKQYYIMNDVMSLGSHRLIKRFTIDLGGLETHELVRAVMMIEVRGNTASSVQKALQRLPEVTSLHRTCGVWDLVIELETTSLYEFDSILSRIRELPGVSNSETCPLLRRIS